MKLRFKNGKRSDMTPIERAFAKAYDRLRKRSQRHTVIDSNDPWGPQSDDWLYIQGYKDALDMVANDKELQYLNDAAKRNGLLTDSY